MDFEIYDAKLCWVILYNIAGVNILWKNQNYSMAVNFSGVFSVLCIFLVSFFQFISQIHIKKDIHSKRRCKIIIILFSIHFLIKEAEHAMNKLPKYFVQQTVKIFIQNENVVWSSYWLVSLKSRSSQMLEANCKKCLCNRQ